MIYNITNIDIICTSIWLHVRPNAFHCNFNPSAIPSLTKHIYNSTHSLSGLQKKRNLTITHVKQELSTNIFQKVGVNYNLKGII